MTQYEFQYAGACLGQMIDSGASLVADTQSDINFLDVVSIILKRTFDGPFSELTNALGESGHAGVVKLFLGTREMPDGETVYLVGQLNPPLLSPIPSGAIEAMHKVQGVSLTALSENDKDALKLLSPFGNAGEQVAPISPNHIPSWPASNFEELSL